ncbi:thyroid receptor-interacting protein 11 [Aplysia californica]|uniref:Thyroid receptor-interacting protein 11 n=1 Tax=Aplysia californica TaxID=6500 RepID=A0ABM1A3C2_APLCA|nr:thyroid receptor-interacting protein 11 [Aplysia californica]
MSWLGGSLSSLTGQLSNLTKDILTEGTEEISDPATELRLAKEKIQQLDAIVTSQRQENERLKAINKELEEKAEASELQINSISREYRALLEQKEKEGNALKRQHQELLEEHARSAALSLTPASTAISTSGGRDGNSSTLDWSNSSGHVADFASFDYDGDQGDWDFDETLRLQRETNSLRSQVQRLGTQVQHWKSVAAQLGHHAGDEVAEVTASADVLDLQNKIKELEGQLSRSREDLQQQATSLHDHHREKVATLKSRHKTEVEALCSQVSALEQNLADVRDVGSSSQHSGSGTLPEAERSEVTEARDEVQRARLTQALHQTEQAQHERDRLESELSKLRQEVVRLQQQRDSALAGSNGEDLQRTVDELSQKLEASEVERSSLRRELAEVREELVNTKYRLLDQLDANHADAQGVLCELREMRESMDMEAVSRRGNMRAEMRSLVNQMFRVGQQSSELKQSLQTVKSEQEEVRDKAELLLEEMTDPGRQKLTADVFDSLERETLVLREENLKLKEQITLLEKSVLTSGQERQSLQATVTKLKGRLGELTGQDWEDSDTDVSSLLSGERENPRSALDIGQEEVDRELASLRVQLETQKESMSGVEMERADWLMEREALEDVLTELRQKTQEQEQELVSLKSSGSDVVGETSADVKSSQERVATLEAELSSLRGDRDELESALEELDSQHSQALEQLIAQRDRLAAELAQCHTQLQQQGEQLEQVNEKVASLTAQLAAQGQSGGGDSKNPDSKNWEEKCLALEREMSFVREQSGGKCEGYEKEIGELKEKLQKGGLVINDLHMDKQELQGELAAAQEQVALKVSKLKEMREENSSLVTQKKEAEDRLSDIEDRLRETEEELERWQQVNEEKQVGQMEVGKQAAENAKLRSRLEHMEKEKQTFTGELQQLIRDNVTEVSPTPALEDQTLLSILEEEARVRLQLENDGKLIHELRQEVQRLYSDKQTLVQQLREKNKSEDSPGEREREHQSQVEAQEEQIESLIQKTGQMEEQLKCEAGKSQGLEEKLKQEARKRQELEEQLKSEASKSQELYSKLCICEGKLEAAGEQHCELVAEVERLQQDANIHAQKVAETAMLKSGQEQMTRMEEELTEKCRLVEELTAKSSAFTQEMLTVKAEISRLEQVCEEKDEQIGQLKSRVIRFGTDLEEIEGSVSAVEDKHIEELRGKEQELDKLREKNLGLERTLSQTQEMNKLTGTTHLSDAHISEREGGLSSQERERLEETISQLEVELSLSRETITALRLDLLTAQDTVQCHEAGIAHLNKKTEEQRKELEKVSSESTRQESHLAVLRQTSVDKETVLADVQGRLSFLLSILSPQQLQQLQHFTDSNSQQPALEYHEVKAIEYFEESQAGAVNTPVSGGDKKRTGYQQHEDAVLSVNGSIVEDVTEDIRLIESSQSDQKRFQVVEKELEELRERLKEKDTIVSELQKSNSSLLGLLEGTGDRSGQVSTHKLEAELRSLQAEREQMVAVVSEKSRENSSLKSEVHRLMGVVAAGQAALDKLQTDNKELEQRQRSPPRDNEAEDDEMRREALTNMARLVRDRETEIEALQQKNTTLLAVLQESSSQSEAASHLGPLLREKETLAQQVVALNAEREQLVACLTQKHSEAVAYHGETQRLASLLASGREETEKAKSEYQALVPTFEDKCRALVSAQGEVAELRQRLREMEVRHGELLQRSSSLEVIGHSSQAEHNRVVESELRDTLSDREQKIQALSRKVKTLEESMASREAECHHLRKQTESSKFQLTGLVSELDDLKGDREQLQAKTIAQESECAGLREAVSKLTLSMREKDLEVSGLREQVATLNALLQERDGEDGQVAQLMRENESVMSSTRQLQQERDQQAMLAEQRLQEGAALRAEIQHMKDKEFKLSRELERLRGHLLQIEEGYTKEALDSEEREKDLRNRLAVAEEQLMSSSSHVERASEEWSRRAESLEQQVQQMSGQRDSAFKQVAAIQDQCQQYATSLANLQLVLEHFQKEKDSAIAAETEHYKEEASELREKLSQLQSELQATRDDLAEALDGLEAAGRLSEQLDRKEDALRALKEEVLLRENALSAAEEEIHKLTSSTEAKVDKVLMHNIVMTWLTSPENKRSEIVQLIGSVLSFSQDDFKKIESAHGHGGLLSTIFRRPSANSPASGPSNQSFSQLFVKFLERESSPPPSPVRLPAEAMAAETQHRHKPPNFNPFMAPRHVTHEGPRAASSSMSSSHLLMSPEGPATSPLFAPLTHSAGESAILKDVLGNS